MNIALLTFGIFLVFASVVGCSAIRGHLSSFRDWAIRTQYWGPIAFSGACGLLVLVITWPWSY